MIIDNFVFGALSIAPAKADAPLIVYADAMLTRAFALQPFQAIRRWKRKSSRRCAALSIRSFRRASVTRLSHSRYASHDLIGHCGWLGD
jgi:hypothetical protein